MALWCGLMKQNNILFNDISNFRDIVSVTFTLPTEEDIPIFDNNFPQNMVKGSGSTFQA